MNTKKECRMEGAPEWYDTHLDDLHFEWSKEEKLEIERYCEKILRNVAEEEMTPLERWKAHMQGKPADRKPVILWIPFARITRTLDAFADALKPIDLYRNPKLIVKGMLATVARYKLDVSAWPMICYAEGMWGGHAKMTDYGNPAMVGEPAIKTRDDVERVDVPDPYSDGLYPGFLWANRETRRIYDAYKLPLPIWTSISPGPTDVTMTAMMGWSGFMKALRKDPELAKAAAAKANIWCKRIGRALIKECKPDGIYCAQLTGGFPLKGNEWVADAWRELGLDLKAADPNVHLSYAYSFLSGIMEWYQISNERGATTPDLWDGGLGGRGEGPHEKALEWHKEHGAFLSYAIPDETLEKSPESIDEEVKALSELGRSHRKFAPSAFPAYNAPPENLDAAVAAFKKYNKL